MADESTGSTGAVDSGAATPTTSAPSTAAPTETLSAEVIDTITSAPAGGAPDTIKIGDHEIPLSALADLPDDVLRKIKRKIKSAGAEREVSLFDALEAVPKADGWQKKQWQAAQREKELDQIADGLKADPINAYAAMHGVSRSTAAKEIAKQVLADLDYENLAPAERAKVDRERELERKAAKADDYERVEKEREAAAAATQAQRTLTPMIKSGLQGAGLPIDEVHVAHVAEELSAMMQSGYFSAGRGQVRQINADDIAEAAKAVAERAEKLVGHRFTDPDAFIAKNPDQARAIAQAYAKSVSAKRTPPKAPPNTKVGGDPASDEPQTWEEHIARVNKKMGIR